MGVDQPAAGVLVFTHNGGHHVEGLTAYMRLTSASPPWAVWAQPEPAVGGLGFSQKNQGGISGIPALPPAAAWAQPEPAVGGLGFTHRKGDCHMAILKKLEEGDESDH